MTATSSIGGRRGNELYQSRAGRIRTCRDPGFLIVVAASYPRIGIAGIVVTVVGGFLVGLGWRGTIATLGPVLCVLFLLYMFVFRLSVVISIIGLILVARSLAAVVRNWREGSEDWLSEPGSPSPPSPSSRQIVYTEDKSLLNPAEGRHMVIQDENGTRTIDL